MGDPAIALTNWIRILKPGGHLIVTVPDEDMYEQGVFPSTFNSDHKWTFTINKFSSWSDKSRSLFDLIASFGDTADVIKIEQLTGTYRYGLDRQDQTRTPIGEAAIEFVIRKRTKEVMLHSADKHLARPTDKTAARPSKGGPAIALHRPGAIGDIIMTLALVPLLKAKYPEHEIHYFCNGAIGNSLKRLMAAAGVNRGFNAEKLEEKRGNYEKVFNLIGYPLHEGYPEKPMRRHLIASFADEMGLAIVDYPELPHLTLDAGPKPVVIPRYATIHPQAGWSAYKNWDPERWEEVIAARDDIKFYQIGSEGDTRLRGAIHEFMGKPLDASIDLMANANLHLGIDSWTNHLTNIEWKGWDDLSAPRFTPAIILWGSTQASAAGYYRNKNISLDLVCQPCFREDPKISRMPRGPCINPPGQDYEHPRHACMASITTGHVLMEMERLWPCA
jgi:ADP-heptose:LPS heptosyltransferase